MATFKFGRAVDIHWYGNEIVGPADTVFSIPDQLYNEFESEFRPIEPSLTWINTNESAVATIIGTSPVSVLTAGTTSTISFSSSTNPNGYLLAADGSGGLIYVPASTSGLTSVVGVSPISSIISGGIASVSIDTTALTGLSAETVRTRVKNSSGSTISKGQVVYVTGSDGTNALIGLSTASTEAGSSKTLGIAASTMTNNAFGYIVENGQLSNIDTSAATAGDSVWLGNAPGSLVFGAPPAEPSHSVYLGVVTKANVSTGEILVKVQNGYELNELHDVFTTGVSTALPLVYSSTSSGWVAQALTSVGISAGAVNSSILADNAVVAAKIAAASVDTSKISSGSATTGSVLTANGSGGASFSPVASGGLSLISSETISSGVSTVAKPANAKIAFIRMIGGGSGGGIAISVSTVSSTATVPIGGSGGQREEFWVSASDFSSIINYSVGAGGSGAVGGSYTSATIANINTAGTSGGTTSFGPYSVSQNPVFGEKIEAVAYTNQPGQSNNSSYSGYFSGGGGAGVGLNLTTMLVPKDGGGTVGKWFPFVVGGGGAAGVGSLGATGSGTSGANGSSAGHGGGAGGGKASSTTLTANCSSGNGGNGAYPGGGGGAAGGMYVTAARISTFTVTAGSGGNGADGQIYVEWYG